MNMKLLDLPYDILSLVADEIYKIRAKRLPKELILKWIKKRPYKILIDSGGRRIHEGRAFLSKDKTLKSVMLIGIQVRMWCGSNNVFDSKYHLCGSIITGYSIAGQGFNLSREVYKKFKRIADRNGWKDFNKLEEKQEIVRYMMEKEDTKMTTY